MQFTDPLATLPEPGTDRDVQRVYPDAPNRGAVRWRDLAGEMVAFETRMPERLGDVGWLRGRGMWANGGWYPEPVTDDIIAWSVHLRIPDGAVGVMNGESGTELWWRGEADRVAIAAIAGGRVVEESVAGGTVRFVERGAADRHARRETIALLEDWPFLPPPDLVVVEDFDLVRIARAAPGVVYLADRAFRVFPGLERFHRAAVRRSLYAAATPAPDAWTRDFVATALDAARPAASVKKALGWLAWNPIVDDLLYDGTLPYFSDVFNEAHAGGATLDGRAAALQVDDRWGAGTADKLARLVLGGMSMETAAAALAVDAPVDVAYPREQDYVAMPGAVERIAPDDAFAEPVVVEVDGERRVWLAGPGPDALPVEGRRIRVDPSAHVSEADLANNRWPPRWTTVATGWIDDISPSQGTFSVWGALLFRRQNDSRNLYLAGLAHDAQDLVSAQVGWVRWLGPLVDRRRREHRLSVQAGPALLDPAFRPTTAGAVAVGGSAGYSWDTREEDSVAISGHRLGFGVGGGFVPGSDLAWASASGSATGLLPLTPRWVIALRGKAGWASGDVEHRLLPLGGGDNVRAVSVGEFVANERIVASAELRWAPMRHASIPVGLGWVDEIELVPGLDAGAGWRGGERVAAAGASLGLYGTGDFLGAKPELVGITLALPVWTEGVREPGPQFYLTFDHAF